MRVPRTVYRGYERLRPGRHRTWPASFADRLTHPVPDRDAVVRLMLERGTRPDLSDAGRIPVAPAAALAELAPGEIGVTWAGHASCVVRMGDATILTDPVWSRRIPGTKPRLTPPGVPWKDLPPVDAVVISHNHFDHLDAPTIRKLPRSTPMLVPGGLGWWLRRYGFREVVELDWWESAQVAGLDFTLTPAHHWSRRTLWDTCRSLWGGWMMSAPVPGARVSRNGAGAAHALAELPGSPARQQVFFAGDSAYGPAFTQIGEQLGAPDIALMPVGAFHPRWFMKPLHMSPTEAVRACGDLGASRMVTVHWGTFALSKEPLLAPREQAVAAWEQDGRRRADLWDLAVGETRVLARTRVTQVTPGAQPA